MPGASSPGLADAGSGRREGQEPPACFASGPAEWRGSPCSALYPATRWPAGASARSAGPSPPVFRRTLSRSAQSHTSTACRQHLPTPLLWLSRAAAPSCRPCWIPSCHQAPQICTPTAPCIAPCVTPPASAGLASTSTTTGCSLLPLPLPLLPPAHPSKSARQILRGGHSLQAHVC